MTRYTRYHKTFNKKTTVNPERELEKEYQAQSTKCLRCRQSGHKVRDCPLNQGIIHQKICYNCGQSDHSLKECPNPATGHLKHAACYVCGETGHLAGSCPKNERGLYPDGGGCRHCGSIRHLAKNCNPMAKDPKNILLGKQDDDDRVGADDDTATATLKRIQADNKAYQEEQERKTGKAKKVKVVKF